MAIENVVLESIGMMTSCIGSSLSLSTASATILGPNYDLYVESYLKVKSIGKPELIDLDFTSRGELTRLAFIAGGVDFTDT